MTPLSPERLEELAAAMAAQDELAFEVGETPWRQDAIAALRAGAAAWRIAADLSAYARHATWCRPQVIVGNACTCGLAALEQRLAALGGEGERG